MKRRNQGSVLLALCILLTVLNLWRVSPSCDAIDGQNPVSNAPSQPVPKENTRQKDAASKNFSKALPDRLIAVFGLESSGTTFVADVLARALDLPVTRFKLKNTLMSKDRSWMLQHVSLPTGSFKEGKANFHRRFERLPVLDMLAPDQCAAFGVSPRRPRPASVLCQDMGLEHLVPYPDRFFVNITSHLEWYRQRGMDVTAVLMIRDRSMHFQGVYKQHCPNATAAQEQFLLGRQLLQEAVGHPNTIVVSYESLMLLQDAYVKHLYQTLHIDSTYIPSFADGNAKYVQRNISH